VLRAEPPRSHARVPVVAPAPAAAPALPLPSVEPTPAFQIQVGSFVEAGNAARMAEQLRAEGRAVETLTVHVRRVRYRILAPIEDGADGAALLARLRELGLSPRIASGAVAVTGFLSTPEADDIAGRLEDEGIVVRVEEENRAVSYHVVRVGGYPTAEAAERGRAELVGRGLEGFVVRLQQGDGSIDP
jgi:cell division protein FtsN